jgi:hypothetical protein
MTTVGDVDELEPDGAGPVVMAPLTLLRHQAADALQPADETDPVVLTEIVDSLTPPALMVMWDDPWLEPGATRPTMAQCMWRARLRIVCVAWRLEPGSGYDELSELVAYTLGRMRDDGYPWTLDRVSAPTQFDLAGITYLAATVNYWTETSI